MPMLTFCVSAPGLPGNIVLWLTQHSHFCELLASMVCLLLSLPIYQWLCHFALCCGHSEYWGVFFSSVRCKKYDTVTTNSVQCLRLPNGRCPARKISEVIYSFPDSGKHSLYWKHIFSLSTFNKVNCLPNREWKSEVHIYILLQYGITKTPQIGHLIFLIGSHCHL